MGNRIDCCHYKKEEKIGEFSKKIFKIYSEIERKNIGKYILCYDLETNITEKKYLPTIIKTLKGLGELIYMNNLYLCGGDDSYLGSNHFFKYTIDNGLHPLINCIYSHKFPTLVGVDKCIYCIGGLEDNLKCERYLIDQKRWESINSLPTSRSGCSAFFDKNSSNLYLFGGYNYIKNRMLETILLMKVSDKHNNIWEEMNIVGGEFMKKSMMGIIQIDNNLILIVGGYEYNEEKCCDVETDKVLKFDLENHDVFVEEYRLMVPSTFNSKNCVEYGYDSFDFLIDDNFNVHKFSREERKLDCISKINNKLLDCSL